MLTQYGEKLNTTRPLQEYPRPQMTRDSYLNLNGKWRYAITRSNVPPQSWDGDIIVPFCVESKLSGVEKPVGPDDILWYRRKFSLPASFMKGRLLLHFGAVDQSAVVLVNGREAGRHEGGYLPFSVDITSYIEDGEQELTVMVTDPTDLAPYPRGAQKLEHGGAFHAPVSGIWQTVWLESVPDIYVRELRITPLYDDGAVEVLVEGSGGVLEGQLEVFAGSTFVVGAPFRSGKAVRLRLPGFLSWSPKTPFLYTLKVRGGEDAVGSYFGMRKFEVRQNDYGQGRLFLNNKPFFGAGVVDSGLFSDGLYTAPSESALRDDIRYIRECGFNMVRKQGKIEPLRWYHLCDKAGLIVWQDLPAGGEEGRLTWKEKLFSRNKTPKDDNYVRFGRESAEGRAAFMHNMEQAAATLYNVPCLAAWVLFQDGRGQFDAASAAETMRKLDPTRLVDHASGKYDQGGGDILSLHLYSYKKPLALPENPDPRAFVLTETGGFGLVAAEHFFGREPACPTKVLAGREALAEALANLYKNHLIPLAQQGMCGFFLAHLADAEDYTDGLLTWDRRQKKLNPKGLATLNGMLKG